MPRTRETLQARQDAGETLDLCFFWGHTGDGVGPWVLSQWREAPFTLAGHTYRTAEHWMMAEKARLFGDDAVAAAVLTADTPGAVKALGRTVAGFDPEEWERVRFAIVRTGNVEKFRQHPALAAWLFSTGDAVLVEASPNDAIWGIGLGASNPAAQRVATWRGLNLLGFALAEVRERLRAHPDPQLPPGFVSLPWQRFPDIHPHDLFWRMGEGESHLAQVADWWSTLSDAQRVEVELLHPATGPWAGWYEPAG